MTGAEMIQAERRRQIEAEGWTAEHDDDHFDGDLLAAAYSYLTVGLMHVRPDHPSAAPPMREMPIGPSGWPWLDGWKPDLGDPIPNLVKAGALISAEIDRLQRAEIDDKH